MFKAIDIWKRLDGTKAMRYRCFQRLTDGQFCVQSADYYHLSLREEQFRMLDRQFLELFIEDLSGALHSIPLWKKQSLSTILNLQMT